MCQFLLGTVQHEIITESELKYFIMCQFLLGTVQQEKVAEFIGQ